MLFVEKEKNLIQSSSENNMKVLIKSNQKSFIFSFIVGKGRSVGCEATTEIIAATAQRCEHFDVLICALRKLPDQSFSFRIKKLIIVQVQKVYCFLMLEKKIQYKT